jgi:pullulanase/glycogen debranching enzyme
MPRRIELCLFDEGSQELARLPLPGPHRRCLAWPAPGAGAGPGLRPACRGPWRPEQGHWFNPNKLLLDPWAREIVGRFAWRRRALRGRPHTPPAASTLRDNAAHALKASVVDERPGSFDWGDDHPPCTPLADTVFYELHVRGFSRLIPACPRRCAAPMPASPTPLDGPPAARSASRR